MWAARSLAALTVFLAATEAGAAVLVAHWPFDEGGGPIAHDVAGAFPGTLAGGAAFVAGGISGNAISLDRSTGSLVNMGAAFPGLASGDFSVVAWVKTTDTAADGAILSKHESFSENGYFLALNQTGNGGAVGKATFVASEFVAQGATSTTSVTDGAWHQIVGVYREGGEESIYVDGSPAEASNASEAIVANGAPFLVGGANQSGSPNARFTGLIDEVRVYSGALTDAEIDALFEHPGIDPDGVLDDFLCDQVKVSPGSPKFQPVTGVPLVTPFDDVVVDVAKPLRLCLPADKNASGVLDEATHLEAYQAKPVKGSTPHAKRTGLAVTNQLGQIALDTVKLELLLVPTAKSLADPPPAPPDPATHLVSHFACYKVKVAKGTPKLPKGVEVTVRDQFTDPAKVFALVRPLRLCAPTEKSGEAVTSTLVHLLCYKAKPAKTTPRQPPHQRRTNVLTSNQFGTGSLDTVKEAELCIPSLVAAP